MSGIVLGLLIVTLLLVVVSAAPAMAAPFIPGPPDGALALTASVTKAASANSDWLDLGQGFEPGGLGMLIAGVVDVSAITTAGGETYAFHLEEAPPDEDGVVDAGNAVAIGVAVSAAAVGIVLAKGILTKRFVRLSLVVAGTGSPSITYTGQLNPA
jgi:hypothetical protein